MISDFDGSAAGVPSPVAQGVLLEVPGRCQGALSDFPHLQSDAVFSRKTVRRLVTGTMLSCPSMAMAWEKMGEVERRDLLESMATDLEIELVERTHYV